MKLWKRNALVAAVLILVCGGIYLNWRYEEGRAADLVSTLDQEKILDEAKLVIQTRENDLEVVETIFPISARLIANKAGYKFKRDRIQKLVGSLARRSEVKP